MSWIQRRRAANDTKVLVALAGTDGLFAASICVRTGLHYDQVAASIRRLQAADLIEWTLQPAPPPGPKHLRSYRIRPRPPR